MPFVGISCPCAQSHTNWFDLISVFFFFFCSNAVESSSVPLQQQPLPSSQPQNHTKNSKRKKSVMLNLKSGAINSVTFEVLGNYSTRFAGNTQRRRKCLQIGGIALGCLCFFALGIAVSKLFDAETCKCKWKWPGLGHKAQMHVCHTHRGMRDRVSHGHVSRLFIAETYTHAHVSRPHAYSLTFRPIFIYFFRCFAAICMQRQQQDTFAWRKIVFEQVSGAKHSYLHAHSWIHYSK